MLYLTKRVASNYCILDSEDGAVDWVSLDELRKFVSQGVVIEGVKLVGEDLELTPHSTLLPAKLCNWNGGENIFTTASQISFSRTWRMEIKAGKKKYKCDLVEVDGSKCLEFTSGVLIVLDATTACSLEHAGSRDCLNIMKSLVQ